MKNEIIIFENQNVKLEVNMKNETVWLTQEQMGLLFGKSKSTINEHIKNIYKVTSHLKNVTSFVTLKNLIMELFLQSLTLYNFL